MPMRAGHRRAVKALEGLSVGDLEQILDGILRSPQPEGRASASFDRARGNDAKGPRRPPGASATGRHGGNKKSKEIKSLPGARDGKPDVDRRARIDSASDPTLEGGGKDGDARRSRRNRPRRSTTGEERTATGEGGDRPEPEGTSPPPGSARGGAPGGTGRSPGGGRPSHRIARKPPAGPSPKFLFFRNEISLS